MNPVRQSFRYYRQLDYVIEGCSILIAKMQEKQQIPTQNVQRVKAEPRDEGPSINVITHNDMATRGAAEKDEAEPLIYKSAIKQ